MAKKIVRGITDVKTINNQDFDTNNVNDLLSDGQYNYIHRKKGKTEEYHNLTDNIKTISSDNTELLSVTNYNKTTNTATLHPKHDAQKEQLLESTRSTITIHHGENGTDEKTTVDTNPQKVLEHENLLTDYGIGKNTSGNTTTLGIEYTRVTDGFDLNTLTSGNIRGSKLTNAPSNNESYFIQSFGNTKGDIIIQTAFKRVTSHSESHSIFRRYNIHSSWGEWREQLGDKSTIDDLLAQKQDTLIAGNGITIDGQTISATGGTSSTIQKYDTQGEEFKAYKHVVISGGQALTTFVFNCFHGTAEHVLTGELKEELKLYVLSGFTYSNGGISISNDGTTMKLMNSNSTESGSQQGTFTFFDSKTTGGVPGV